MTLEFRNIKDGNVCVYADGVPVESELHVDEFVSVSLDAKPNIEYKAEITFKANAREYRNIRLAWALTRIPISIKEKDKIWKWRELDDKELMRNIMTSQVLTDNEKIRLTESW